MFLRAVLSVALLASASHTLANEYFVVVPMPGKVSPVTLTLTNGAPPAGLVGSAYLYDFKPHLEVLNDASFSGAGVTWSVMGSALPDGLSLSSDGVVSGVPQTAGIYEAILRADYKQKYASNSYSFSIGANGNLALDTPGSYNWTVPPGVTSVSVVVVGGGAGGESGAITCKGKGGSGGTSSFGTYAVASGGEGGYSVTSKGGVVLAGDGGGAGGTSNGGGGGAGGYSGVGGEGAGPVKAI